MLKICCGAVLCGALIAAVWPVDSRGSEQRSLLLKPEAPEFSARAPEVATVRFETSKGNVEIEVTRAWSPLGADRFIALVRHGYYDGARFFRVTAGPLDSVRRQRRSGDRARRGATRTIARRSVQADRTCAAPSRSPLASPMAGRRRCSSTCATTRRRTTRSRSRRSAASSAGMDIVDTFNGEHGEGPGGIRAGKQDAVLRRRQRLARRAVSAARLHPPRRRCSLRVELDNLFHRCVCLNIPGSVFVS